VKQRQQNLIGAEMLKPRPPASGLGFRQQPTDAAFEPATKRRRTADNYRTSSQLQEPGTDEPSNQLLRYINYINSDTFGHSSSELAKLYCDFSML